MLILYVKIFFSSCRVPSESDVCSEVPNVPSHVTLELRPFSLSSWLYVQGKAQNPRLRY